MQNVGVVIGTLLVGVLVEISIEWIFISNFILFAFYWFVVYRYYYVPKAALVKEQVAKKGQDKTPLSYVWVIGAILILFLRSRPAIHNGKATCRSTWNH